MTKAAETGAQTGQQPSLKQQQREDRRAAAMRENLRKRKAQAAERAQTAKDD